MESIPGPVVEIDVIRAHRNISKMQNKAVKSNAELRPHFKTHQSLEVAQWFRDQGIDRCTVSSPQMAEFFASGGWRDILIAIPAQLGALDVYRRLAGQTRLGLIGDSASLIQDLEHALQTEIDFWIEIDAGYGRSGVRWDYVPQLEELGQLTEKCKRLNFRGLLCHAGDSYACEGAEEIMACYGQSLQRLQSAQATVEASLGKKIELSYGDTPTCSVGEDFSPVDELRPGNFVFYDLMQQEIGSCGYDDIALSMACPVIGVYPDRAEVVIHGGVVHFSKDHTSSGAFGQVFVRDDNGQHSIVEGATLTSLSQEHGVISGPMQWIEFLSSGDIIHIFPAHSCLAMDCMHHRPESIRYVGD